MRIPFTNLEIGKAVEKKSTAESQGLSYGTFSATPEQDHHGQAMRLDHLFVIFNNQADVQGCVRELSNYIGTYGWQLKDKKTGEVDNGQATKEVDEILNFCDAYDSLIDDMVEDFGIAGNIYIEKVRNESGKILGLRTLDPRTMAIVADAHGTIHKYLQRVSVSTNVVEFDPEEIIHIRNKRDRDNPSFGRSPIKSVFWEAKTDLAAMFSNYFFFENHAVPSNLFILEDGLTGAEAKAAMDKIKDQYGGSTNAHKSAILKGIKDVKQLRLSQKDIEFLNGRKFSTEKICSAYGVPKVLLGYTDGVNFSNHEGQIRKFVENTVRPIERMIAAEITRQLLTELRLDAYTFQFVNLSLEDVDSVHVRVRDDFKAGMITLNEARGELNLEPVSDPLADQHIFAAGAGHVLLEDIGIDPIAIPEDAQT